jgi:hypothetical protein
VPAPGAGADALGEILYEPGGQMQHAYFPTTAIVSLHYVMESGASAETAGVGNEGVVGISLFMGGDTTPARPWCRPRATPTGWRPPAEAGIQSRRLDAALLLRYTQALITQMIQTAACNRHHSVEQQLCRWLLLTLDRLPSQELIMTQELVASMLGVRREGITQAAGNLQQAGLIRYRRGHISVQTLRTGGRACECYAVVKKELGRCSPTCGARPALRRRCMTGRSAGAARSSDRTSPADHLSRITHDCDHQQHVNETTHGDGRNESQGPQDDEYDGDGIEHGKSSLAAPSTG